MFTIDKFGQNVDYSTNLLPPQLIKYAALDALLSRLVTEAIMGASPISNSTLILPPEYIDIDTQRFCAQGLSRRFHTQV